MPELRLEISADRLTVDDAIQLEEVESGDTSMSDVKALVSRFVVDANGADVEPSDALALVGKLTIAQLFEALDGLGDSFTKVRESAINPPQSGP